MISFAEFLHKYLVLVLWTLWITCGALYYCLHDGYPYHVALYKAVSIGWSIGWDMSPHNTDMSDKPASMTYSCFHNCMGVMFTGMAVIMIAEKVVADTDDWMVEINRNRSILQLRKSTPGLRGKIIAFVKLNKTTVELVIVCFFFGFCGVMLGVSLGNSTWTIRKSMDFTLSTLCTCGYLGLPAHALPWKYVMLAIYSNFGIPFLSIGLGALITMFIVNPNEMELHKKISAPLTQPEIEYMKSFGMDDGDGFISRKEYTMLIIIRIGRVKADVVEQIRNQFQDLLELHGEKKLLSYEHLQRVSNRSFRLSKIFPLNHVDIDDESSHFVELKREGDDVEFDEEVGLSETDLVNESDGPLPQKPIVEENNIDDSDAEKKDSNENEDEELDDEFHFEGPASVIPTLRDIKEGHSNAKAGRKISNDSYRNLKHSSTTMKHLEKVKKHNEMILLRESSSSNIAGFDIQYIKIHLRHLYESHQFFVIIAWIVWLVLAGCFYSIKMNISYLKGFYVSVNVGYSVYWTSEESDPIEKAFSVAHLLVGQVFMSVLMAVVASNLIITKSVWYGEKQLQEQLKIQREQDSLLELIYHYLQYLFSKFKVTLLLIVWLAIGAFWSCYTVKWPVIQGLYFAITSLSMGGIWSIPENSKDASYFFVGLYTALGAPILLLNASMMAEYIAHLGNSYLVENVVYRAVNKREIEYMQLVGMEDGSGQLDEQEYVLLTLIRLKALPHDIVSTIVEMFNMLDDSNSGNIPYADIINHKLAVDSIGQVQRGSSFDRKQKHNVHVESSPNAEFDKIGSVKSVVSVNDVRDGG